MEAARVRRESIHHVGWITMQYGKNMNALDEVIECTRTADSEEGVYAFAETHAPAFSGK